MLGMELDPFVVEIATGDESQQTRLRISDREHVHVTSLRRVE